MGIHASPPPLDQTTLLKNMSHDAAEFLPQLKRRESICSSTHGLGGRWNRQGGVVVGGVVATASPLLNRCCETSPLPRPPFSLVVISQMVLLSPPPAVLAILLKVTLHICPPTSCYHLPPLSLPSLPSSLLSFPLSSTSIHTSSLVI